MTLDEVMKCNLAMFCCCLR